MVANETETTAVCLLWFLLRNWLRINIEKYSFSQGKIEPTTVESAVINCYNGPLLFLTIIYYLFLTIISYNIVLN